MIDPQELPALQWIERHRKKLFIALAVLMLSGFNGRWRPGRDSAVYRAIGHSVATGRGYTWRGTRARTHYPGLPLVLAGLEKAAGPSPAPALAAVLASGLLALVAVYFLVRSAYSPAIATAVTLGLGINNEFFSLAHEILTDVPFLLGTLVALAGYERGRRVGGAGARAGSLLLLACGLAVAISTRPTAWMLVIALAASSIGGLLGRRRWPAFAVLVLILAAVATWALFDPRTEGVDLLGGGYETAALHRFSQANRELVGRIPGRIVKLLEECLPEAFLGIQLGPGVNSLFSLAVIVAGLSLARRHAPWGIFLLGSFCLFAVLGSVPRYYTMLVPFLLLGSLVNLHALALRLPRPWGQRALLLGLALYAAPNLVLSARTVVEQHRSPFLEHLHHGHWAPWSALASAAGRNRLPPGAKILSPESELTTYLLGRPAYRVRKLVASRPVRQWSATLAGFGARYAILPADLYRKHDRAGFRMFRGGVIVEEEELAAAGGLRLCRVRIDRSPRKWWKPEAAPRASRARRARHR